MFITEIIIFLQYANENIRNAFSQKYDFIFLASALYDYYRFINFYR